MSATFDRNRARSVLQHAYGLGAAITEHTIDHLEECVLPDPRITEAYRVINDDSHRKDVLRRIKTLAETSQPMDEHICPDELLALVNPPRNYS